ncbi:MAG: hypothetical protein JW715_08400 [Sedimentisphaerales bacterium]|nr:hypothetical protein [Sedimentisphaerales bacterium]
MLKKNFLRFSLFLVLVICLSFNAARAANILFIAALDETNELMQQGDDRIKAYLEGLGHTVTYFDDDEDEATTEAAAAAADAVFISESVSSGRIRLEITEIETPMVITEAWAYDEMGLSTLTTGVDEQINVATTDIEIVAPGHPLAAGLTGTVSVLSAIESERGTARFSTVIPGSEATVIAQATLSDGRTYDVIFYYEKGAQLALPPADGSPRIAADIRVCIGFDEQSYLAWNDNAFYLLEAAMNFALGIRIQPEAYSPNPANGQKDVEIDADLSWRKGIFGDTHNVYFGTDFNDVNEASPTDPRGVLVMENLPDTSYELDTLEYGKTYYWRVDEVNAPPDTSTIYKGNVWSFTVRNFLTVDNFEDYDANNIIYNVWSDYYVNNTGMTVGYFDPPYIEKTTVHTGSQSMPLYYDNDGTVNEGTALEQTGTLFYSDAERRFDDAQDWTANQVESLSLWYKGYPENVGSFVEEPAGTYTMAAAGTDIWDTADEFHFAYKELAENQNLIIIAKVESIDSDNSNKDTKAGIMIRDSLDPGARNTTLLLTPDPEKGLRFQNRSTDGGVTTREDEDMDPNAMPPYWLKIERAKAGIVRAYRSPNGSDWEQFSIRVVQMQSPIYVGLAVTSHDTTKACEAKFSNVSFDVASLSSQPWKHQDIGIISNELEPMYVVLNGNAAVYNEEDPSAALKTEWTPWEIPLQKFADQGVNLTNISSIGIRFGDKGSNQPGGHGNIFIDDIRLYRPPVE